jgi:hypothetical protein
MKRILNLLMIMMGVALLAACEYATITPPAVPPVTKTVSFATDIIPIFNASCNMSGCHATGNVSPDLTAANAYQSLMDNNYVIAGNSAGSILYTEVAPGGGMNSFLSADDVSLIKAWIDQGAKNN